MDERNDFSKWISKQIRLAGEELIRRSENTDFGGMDFMSDIHIDIDIPTERDQVEIPSINLTFKCSNKVWADDYLKKRGFEE